MDGTSPTVIVAGSLNVDIICSGVEEIARSSGDTTGEPLRIEPGGKGRNIASMLSRIIDGDVAVLGRVSEDPYGLWEVPVSSLEDDGVSTDYVHQQSFDETGQYTGTALVVVDEDGRNMIYAAAGANHDFSAEDVSEASLAFEEAPENGVFVSTLEVPNEAVAQALSTAAENGMRSVIDPGAAKASRSYEDVFSEPVFAITPNEAEAQRLTGVAVTDKETAEEAARELLGMGVENVLITAGGDGAYLVNGELSRHIPVPDMNPDSDVRDETGCGDQVTATLCARLLEGDGIEEAAEKAVEAGTVQYFREGIQPVT